MAASSRVVRRTFALVSADGQRGATAAIPVAKLIHKSEIPEGATGPYRTQWAFDYRESNIAEGALKRYRLRVAVGHPLKDGIDMENYRCHFYFRNIC